MLVLALLLLAPATYVVRLVSPAPLRFAVTANVPEGEGLEMDTTRPGDLPELLEHGWPAFIKDLRVFDAAGRRLEAAPEGEAGWRLPAGASGPFRVEYEVDLQSLAEHGWPAPREAAFVEGEVLSVVGRALFLTTDAMRASRVEFVLPEGWRPYAPWDPAGGTGFDVRSVERLRENLIVLTREAPIVVDAAGLRTIVVPLGAWRPLASEIRRVFRAHLRRFVELMVFREKEAYVAVLLPIRDQGAESYRQSLALALEAEPSRANEASWANLIGHELFHFWNGWRLRGADYASSQWFQEGFTEYAANVSTPPSRHEPRAARKQEGPPLYSAGALVAFTWDVSIREATQGADLVAALEETAAGDWVAFLDAHVRGTEPLPLQEAFARAGLRLAEAADGTATVGEDPAAPARARQLGRKIPRGG